MYMNAGAKNDTFLKLLSQLAWYYNSVNDNTQNEFLLAQSEDELQIVTPGKHYWK
jgi:hypothetical protein